MSRGITILIEFLSAGVVTSLVAGVFSLIVSIKNNKRLIELEGIKQRFVLTQERYKEIKAAYTELINELPEDKLLGHYFNVFYINSLCKQEDIEDGLLNLHKLSTTNCQIIYAHFKKYEYLFLENEKNEISKLIEEFDNPTKRLIEINDDKIDEIIRSKIVTEAKLEELYYDTLKNYLNMFLT